MCKLTIPPLLFLVLAPFVAAAPRVSEVHGDRVVLQLDPGDDVRAGEQATLFFARQLSKQRVEVQVAEVRILACEALRCDAEVVRSAGPVQPGYEMILHRVRETVGVPQVPPPPAPPGAGVVLGLGGAKLLLTGGPADARVRVDDVAACRQLPCAVEVEAGPHEVLAERDGFLPQRVRVAVEGGALAEVALRLEHRPVIEVQSSPPGALVQLDGDEVGRTPIAIALERVEPCQLALSLEGYERQQVEVVPRANETLRLAPLLVRRKPVRAEGWRVAGIVTTSVGAAVAATGGVLLFLSDREDSRATDRHGRYLALPTGGPEAAYLDAWSSVEAAVDRSRLYGQSGASMLGVGAAMVLFGLVAWVDPFDWWAGSPPAATLVPDRRGASFDWRITW